MDFEQHVDIITELEFSCHSIICSLQFLLTPVCRITQKAVLRNFPHYIKKPMATNDFTVKGIPFPEQCTHSSVVHQGFYPTGTGLVSLVWMYELRLQLPSVLASWNNTICKLSVSHKSHNTVSGSVTFNVIWKWTTAIWEWSTKLLCVRHENVAAVDKKKETTKTGSDQQKYSACVGRGANICKVRFQTAVRNGLLGGTHASGKLI